MKRQLKEGPLPQADNPKSVRPVRGLAPAQNDARPGIPAPTVRKTVTWTQPQPTTFRDTGFSINPQNPTTGPQRPLTMQMRTQKQNKPR